MRSATTKKPPPAARAVVPIVALRYAASRRGLPAAATFRAWVAAALAGAGRSGPSELAIRVVDADEGREFNRTYRGRDYATNVLSFSAELPRGVELPLLGDLVICAPVVAREADEQGKALRDHYAHLTIHGVLHLLGYDHENGKDARKMEALECRILAKLGIAAPYN